MAEQQTARRKPTPTSVALGKRIRALRKRRALCLEELAYRAGMHVTYLSSVEHGHRNVTLNVMVALAGALSVSLSTLVANIDERSTK